MNQRISQEAPGHGLAGFVLLGIVLAVTLIPGISLAKPLVEWDFSTGTHGWAGNKMVGKLAVAADGLTMTSIGEDPWLEGPPFDAPADALLRVTIEMRSRLAPVAHLFYGKSFHAERCLPFAVINDGEEHSYTVMVPRSGGPGTRLRIDPCAAPGEVLVRRISVEAILRPTAPIFEAPALPDDFSGTHSVRSGGLTLDHHPSAWNGLRLRLGDRTLAVGYDGELVGTVIDGETEYLRLKRGAVKVIGEPGKALTASCRIRDGGGATWTLSRRFTPGRIDGVIEIESTIAVDREREAVLLPWLTILPGHGTFGRRKHQGLFAGVEYLGDEESSSKADLAGPDHLRRVPDPVKVTLPLMAIEHEGACLGLIWDKSEAVAAGFDSPDRVFGSDGHALWLSGPELGANRFENDLVAHSPVHLAADDPLTTHATVVASHSPSVIGAVRQYLALRPPPPVPEYRGGFDAAVELLAHGWLDSAANEDGRFRHAVWMDRFGAQPAAGAAMFQDWLATRSKDQELAARLREGVAGTLARLDPGDPFASAVSHVRPPAAPLIFGRIPEFVARKVHAARAQLRRFDEQGRIVYHPRDKDYARTHFANHANGLGGRVLAEILETAVLSGDRELATSALAILDRQASLYAHSVPRGAQTWEMPLHTPDIMASAHMISAYVYGYVLTGNDDYLAHARYWAWTGVPFIYLVNPTDGRCGPYATIGVLGATNWVAPVWIGQPVQWCGLVYGSALQLLSDYDQSGPWRQLATGITIAGLQMTWPTDDAERQGLLPDFFHLKRQISDGPAINPGTVCARLPEAFGQGSFHGFHRFSDGSILHAPCELSEVSETGDVLRVSLAGWGERPYHVLLAGVTKAARRVTAAGKPVEISQHADQGLLLIGLKGAAELEIRR